MNGSRRPSPVFETYLPDFRLADIESRRADQGLRSFGLGMKPISNLVFLFFRLFGGEILGFMASVPAWIGCGAVADATANPRNNRSPVVHYDRCLVCLDLLLAAVVVPSIYWARPEGGRWLATAVCDPALRYSVQCTRRGRQGLRVVR